MKPPIRIQLSRRAGFNLQDLSTAFNGRDAVNVARPGKWGNPFTITDKVRAGTKFGDRYFSVPTVEDAIACFREYLDQKPNLKCEMLVELRGKNLACWCKPNEQCHADVLLALANAPLGIKAQEDAA